MMPSTSGPGTSPPNSAVVTRHARQKLGRIPLSFTDPPNTDCPAEVNRVLFGWQKVRVSSPTRIDVLSSHVKRPFVARPKSIVKMTTVDRLASTEIDMTSQRANPHFLAYLSV